MTSDFYGDLIVAILAGDDDRVFELLSKLSLDQLQDLALAGSILSRQCRVVAIDLGEENEPQ